MIRLIDHSALNQVDQRPNAQFLVMPIAEGGDLNNTNRVSLYKDNIDGVVQVAKQIASALAEAHAAGIIHRDIKPKNILSCGSGHEVWVADFGICLLREHERVTETGEAVGPRAFMAPELEAGGRLDVSADVDIYSLGKFIYFLLTGGTILPREKLHEGEFSEVLEKGERYRLVQLLLAKMICHQSARLHEMQRVEEELDKIVTWEHNARLALISRVGISALERLQNRELEIQGVNAQNAEARQQEIMTLGAVVDSFMAWINNEISELAERFSNLGIRLTSEPVEPPTRGALKLQIAQGTFYESLTGVQLTLELSSDENKKHMLQLYLCQKHQFIVMSSSRSRSSGAAPQPQRDQQLAFLPFYRQTLATHPPDGSSVLAYFNRDDMVGKIRGQMGKWITPEGSPRVQYKKTGAVSGSFNIETAQFLPFLVSEWPGVVDRLRGAISEAVDSFVVFVEAGAHLPRE